jgi:metal-responsive CopG/Arc/MetJ family transcriptional regulator
MTKLKHAGLTDRVDLKIHPRILSEIDRIAQEIGITRSDVVRRCVKLALPQFKSIKLPGAPSEAGNV